MTGFCLSADALNLLRAVALCQKRSGEPYITLEPAEEPPSERINSLIEKNYVTPHPKRVALGLRCVRLELTPKGEIVARLLGLLIGKVERVP